MSLIDFQMRTLCLIALRAHRDAGGAQIPLQRSPGLGTLLSILRRLRGSTSLGSRYPSIEDAIDAIDQKFRETTPSDAAGLGTIKKYRDFLFHGGGDVPGEEGQAAHKAVLEVAEFISNRLGAVFGSFETKKGSNHGPYRVVLTCDSQTLDLWPFIVADNRSDWMVLGPVIEGAAWFDSPGDPRTRVRFGDEVLRRDLHKYLAAKGPDDTLNDFIGAAKHDLGAFSPPNHDVLHVHSGREFIVEWVQALSSGDSPREDRFRIGPDDSREWMDESGEWIRYTSFLKKIANWKVLRERLLGIVESAETQEAVRSGTSSKTFIEPNFLELDFADISDGSPMGLDQVSKVVETLTETRGSHTEIVFVQGPAGIGKTRALRSLAISRMRDADENSSPLYLYVQAGSVSLTDLSSIVDAATATTRILVSESVKALARNGLLVLVIDGFDELLGGLSYQEPLESLRPWLDSLGGRGVLLVSARSSYFFNHYRTSLSRARSDLAVGHRVFSVSRWTDEQLGKFLLAEGMEDAAADIVHPDDLDLIRLPVFAATLVAAHHQGLTLSRSTRIADVLLKNYISRESRKLEGSHEGSGGLMSAAELTDFFTNVAELMSDEGLSESDLRYAADMALDSSLAEDREGLTERLTALCSLQYGQSSHGAAIFRFEHEVYFDFFYALYLSRTLSAWDGSAARLELSLLDRNRIAAWTAELVCSKVPDKVVDFLAKSRSFCTPEHTLRRSNSGEFYSAIARMESGYLPGTISSATLEELVVNHATRKISVVDASIDHLDCSFNAETHVQVSSSRIGSLALGDGVVSWLNLDRQSVPSELRLPGAWFSGRDAVARELATRGAVVERDESFDAETELVSDCRLFLHKLNTGVVVSPVIAVATRLPSDYRMRWAQTHADSWQRFVKLLITSELAEVDPISAKGEAMERLRFVVSPTAILESSTDPTQRFWRLLASE